MLVPYSCSAPYYFCLDMATRQAVQFVSPSRLLPDRREGEERIESPIDSVDELELAAPFRDVFRQEKPKSVLGICCCLRVYSVCLQTFQLSPLPRAGGELTRQIYLERSRLLRRQTQLSVQSHILRVRHQRSLRPIRTQI